MLQYLPFTNTKKNNSINVTEYYFMSKSFPIVDILVLTFLLEFKLLFVKIPVLEIAVIPHCSITEYVRKYSYEYRTPLW